MSDLKKVLVIGDIMFDRYVYVETDRFCQEAASVPIYDILSEEERPGGAANVAMNIASLGINEVEVHISGIMDAKRIYEFALEKVLADLCYFGEEMSKTRAVCDGNIVARFDDIKRFSDKSIKGFGSRFTSFIEKLSNYDLIVMSDYDKGTLDWVAPIVVREAECPIIVDSKRKDLRAFEGADYLNINEHEYSVQVSFPEYTHVEELFGKVIITKGKDGAEIHQHEESTVPGAYIVHTEKFPTEKAFAVDVTGCGDTHVAAFAIGILRNPNDPRNAVRFANQCATLAVQKFGTTRISKWDYLKSLEESQEDS